MAWTVYGNIIDPNGAKLRVKFEFNYGESGNAITLLARVTPDAGAYYDTTSSSSATVSLSGTGQTAITNRMSGVDCYEAELLNEGFQWDFGHEQATVTVTASYQFSNWKNRNGNTISGTSSASFSFVIPAKAAYIVTLDSNGGSGAPESLTKWENESLTLPMPVKTGYSFSGWADEDDPSTVIYQPGETYTANEEASLIAVYSPAITSAVITQLYAARDDGRFLWDSQTGKHTSASDDGEYVYIRAWWRVDGADAATISLGATMADTSTVWTGATRQVSKPGTGELYIEGVAEWGTTQTASASGQYDVTVDLSTGAGNPSDTRGTTISTAFFTIDVLAGGHGIAFGKPATQQIFDVGMETNFDHDVRVMGTPLVPIGTILDFAAATAPTGYLVCDGSAVSRTDYAALFAVIGTTWGAGDGSTTFNIPDFRGRTSIGAGTGTATDATAHALASSGGSEGVTLTANESGTHSHGHGMTQPAFTVGKHQHQILNSAVMYNNGSSVTTRMATSGSGTKISLNTNLGYKTLDSDAFAATRTTNAAVTDHAGADATAAHNNLQPFATVTKIIRAL